MTPARILLREAEATLVATAQAGVLSLLETAFISWLQAKSAPPGLSDALTPPLRQYEHVALASLAEVAGWATDKSSLDDGLQWLAAVALDRAGVPAPVVSDGLAQIVLGLAARERRWFAPWHDRVLARCAEAVTPAWLAEGGRIVRGGASPCAAELRIALASRGIVTSTDDEGNALLQRLLRGDLPNDTFHAHLLLIALGWIRRSSPVVLPGQATVGIVAELLRAVPRALQQWPWEAKAKTSKSQLAKWQIDNEYHVQALLWVMLAPVFPDLRREEYAPQVGPIQPRVDFGIPSLRLLIEVKFARTRSALKDAVNEIAQDASNYFTTATGYDQLLVFLWDNAAHSEDHALIIEGMRKFDRVVDAIVISRPGHMMA